MKCPHANPALSCFTEGVPYQELRLTEGCCPNLCGPLDRTGEYAAECKCCGVEWRSKRIAVIFPNKNGLHS